MCAWEQRDREVSPLSPGTVLGGLESTRVFFFLLPSPFPHTNELYHPRPSDHPDLHRTTPALRALHLRGSADPLLLQSFQHIVEEGAPSTNIDEAQPRRDGGGASGRAGSRRRCSRPGARDGARRPRRAHPSVGALPLCPPARPRRREAKRAAGRPRAHLRRPAGGPQEVCVPRG